MATEDVLIKRDCRISGQRNEMLERALAVLDAVEDNRLLTLTQVVAATGLPKATCYRLLQAMVRYRLIRREGRYYGLGSRVFRYVYGQMAAQPVVRLARPELVWLRQQTQLAAALCIRLGAFRIAVAVEDGDDPTRRFIEAGQVSPVYAGAASHILMAWLDVPARDEILAELDWVPLTDRTLRTRAEFERVCADVRQRGWAVSMGERAAGGFAVAVPVIDYVGRVAAALMVTGPLALYATSRLPGLVDVLWTSGQRLSAALHFRGEYPWPVSSLTKHLRIRKRTRKRSKPPGKDNRHARD